MTKVTKIAFAALIGLALTSSALAGGVNLGGLGGVGGGTRNLDSGGSSGGQSGGSNHDGSYASSPVHTLKLACIVGGTPVEFPNDIWVTNTSSATLIKGMALTFAIPSVGVKGSFILPSNVAPGTQVKIADIFGGAEAGAPCTVKIA